MYRRWYVRVYDSFRVGTEKLREKYAYGIIDFPEFSRDTGVPRRDNAIRRNQLCKFRLIRKGIFQGVARGNVQNAGSIEQRTRVQNWLCEKCCDSKGKCLMGVFCRFENIWELSVYFFWIITFSIRDFWRFLLNFSLRVKVSLFYYFFRIEVWIHFYGINLNN